MIFFGPKKCKHDYGVAAFDSSFHTQYTDTGSKVSHHVRWLRCKHCGDRSFDRGNARDHSGVEKVRNRWLEQNIITLSGNGEVYHKDYNLVSVDSYGWGTYGFRVVTGVERLLAQLKEDKEFQELLKHQMVADAFGELETVVKLHENVDK